MSRFSLSLVALLSATTLVACNDVDADLEQDYNQVAEEDTVVAEQPISYGNNTCWYIGVYNEHWVDPANPNSGEHVVGWYRCSDVFATPISVYSTIIAYGSEKDWMIWYNGYSGQYSGYMYQVFVDGWWYWPRRAYTPAAQIFANITLR